MEKEKWIRKMISYYVIDCETTGLSSKTHEVNEVSIIRGSDRIQMTVFIKCEYPERASYDSLLITGKTLADLDDGISKEEAVEKINKFLLEDQLTPQHRCFVAHNHNFDRKFIHALYEKVGQQCPVDLGLCTMAMSRAYAKSLGMVKPKVKLGDACDLVGIKKITAKAHSSKMDSRNTYLLWKGLIEEKQFDYLPFIKRSVHQINADEEPDMSLLEDI